MLRPGQIVGHRYKILRALGIGGMGTVWEAEHIKLGMLVALKLIVPEYADHQEAMARFRREARIAATLQSPNVVRILDYDVDEHLGPFLIMELLEGEDLRHRLAREMVLSPKAMAEMMLQVASGLQTMHEADIIHRDLKPSNIFLAGEPNGREVAKILDFGVAKAREPLSTDGSVSSDGLLVGTFSRMSPEQVLGQPTDHRLDIWSFGLVAFECQVGHPVFPETLPMGRLVKLICADPMPTPSHERQNVPEGFDEWFLKSTARQPDQRFDSIMEQAEELMKICVPSGVGTSTRTETTDLEDWGGADDDSQMAVVHGVDDLRHVSDSEKYFVTTGAQTAGPVTWEQLTDGWNRGQIPWRARVWRAPWLAWHMIEDVLGERRDTVPSGPKFVPQRLTLGPPSIPPKQAPPLTKQVSKTLRAPAKLSPDKNAQGVPAGDQPPVNGYYVSDGPIAVGPVSLSVISKAWKSNRLPETAMVWHPGWTSWRGLQDALNAIPQIPSTPVVFREAAGLESLAPLATLPVTAPPFRSDPIK